MILYEYPFNERVRTLLRLEDLFDRLRFFVGQSDRHEHHAALTTLFEVIEVASRADLKSDLLQELDRQRVALGQFRNSPDVSAAALDVILGNIENASRMLNATPGKAGQQLRDHEWLMSIRSRTIIPGGACEFDLPSYHAWQHKPVEQRQADLAGWIAPFVPLSDCLVIVLKLLRESVRRHEVTAVGGSFQQSLSGKPFQMLQVRVDPALGAIPEISANKYMLWVRFSVQDGDLRPRPYEGVVPFELGLCNL